MPHSAERVLRLVEASRPRIAIFSETRDWHARRIARHLTAMGAEPRLVHLAKCQFTSASPSGIAIPGFRRTLPDACIVRSVPGGTFEAVTRISSLRASRAKVPVSVCSSTSISTSVPASRRYGPAGTSTVTVVVPSWRGFLQPNPVLTAVWAQ